MAQTQDVGGAHSGVPCSRCTGGAPHALGCRVVQAVAGGFHSMVLTACGNVRTCGHNAYGQLGHGDTTQRQWFTPVRALRDARVRAVVTGEDHCATVSDDGRVHVWGRGDWGQLGLADSRSHWKPMLLPDVTLQTPAGSAWSTHAGWSHP
jgi:alpha-tubulin suppressor-like RCC1 family protein